MNTRTFSRPMYLLLALFVSHAMQAALSEESSPGDQRLVGKIDYWFVGHTGQTDDAERLLVWKATVQGDLQGEMKWWFVNPPRVSASSYEGGRMTFYAARWELWVDDKLMLAGESAGKTVFPDGADGVWDGHGRVTEAKGDFRKFKGRRVYETGPVMRGQDPPRTYSGAGMFVIY